MKCYHCLVEFRDLHHCRATDLDFVVEIHGDREVQVVFTDEEKETESKNDPDAP